MAVESYGFDVYRELLAAAGLRTPWSTSMNAARAQTNRRGYLGLARC